MISSSPRKRKKVRPAEQRIETVRLDSLSPATVNGRIYKPIDPDGDRVQSLAADIKKNGLLQPLHVTTDDVILSGHTRAAACEVAGLEEVRVIREPFPSTVANFEELLVGHNHQRVKTPQEMLREEVVRTSPEDAHNALLAAQRLTQTQARKRLADTGLRIIGKDAEAARRSRITDAKMPMLKAALAVIEKYREYWPLTLRQVHYRLLGGHVVRNADRRTVYENTQNCYSDLSDLLTRARLTGFVPWESMHDPTRPVSHWKQWDTVGEYAREQFDGFLTGYKRNLLVSQPSYVELVVEKLTVLDIAERAAGYYHVPVGVGRGYSSVTSLEDTAERFKASGKDSMVLLIAGDLDPEGESITETWASHLYDEHGVGRDQLHVVKVGVNPEQVRRYGLASIPTKDTSSRQKGFVEKHGNHAYELEAFEPDVLQDIIRNAIRDVLDLTLFAQEQQQEKDDARHLMAMRRTVSEMLRSTILPD